jgi:transposase
MNIIGIDVSKAKLGCAWFRDENKVKAKVVANRLDGWEELIKWAQANTDAGISGLHFVMEATDPYHENSATCLLGNQDVKSLVDALIGG